MSGLDGAGSFVIKSEPLSFTAPSATSHSTSSSSVASFHHEDHAFALPPPDNDLVDVKPPAGMLIKQEPDTDMRTYSYAFDDDDWMDKVDVSRFASDVASVGFDFERHEPSTSYSADGRCFPKPNYSYSCLIALALKNSRTGQLTVSEIYAFMCENFPYFGSAPSGWKNSVRHNLSLNKCFMKIEVETPGTQGRKSCLWMIRPEKAQKMEMDLQRWRDKDSGKIGDAIKRPEDLEAVHAGRHGVPKEDRSLRTIENTHPVMKNILVVQPSSCTSTAALPSSESSGSVRATQSQPTVHSGPTRAALDLNDRMGIGYPEPKPSKLATSTSSSVQAAFPVRYTSRDERSATVSTSSGTNHVVTLQPTAPHKPNILRRSSNSVSQSYNALSRIQSSAPRTPVKNLSELMPPESASKLEITPPKKIFHTPKKGELDAVRPDGEESPSPVRNGHYSSYEAVHAALTNNSLLDCALEQSPYKGPVTFPMDLGL